jgi:hypothetical protein
MKYLLGTFFHEPDFMSEFEGSQGPN